MALSEQEQRALREIERSLMAEDPKFGTSVSGGGAGTTGTLTLRGIAVIVIGLLLLVGGVALSQQSLWFVSLSIIGFLVMLGGAVWMLRSQSSFDKEISRSVKKSKKGSSGFGGKMEESFRRRFEQ
ncbi:hypothetical membrane protein [Corynebacterium kutscheri]|uniref:Hypothetical membrane protein n=1 Tax=Corynebacterium kutscheri TaxID=35755 RepID=A0A0F6R0Z2_9CORY|nr:DUF3040 domain-containing protein [Corynebacterium kutscheri]AKE41570.1 Protein of unknown function (DUF3040) [Corynebacterium kutscheri]VEH08849.1 hypothetical membrane protein [Corynebacterium kutscheri]VEH09894.1 hypothetical membrane protein [Corynebacterium kutscheri]VEH79978.1 hypothetical membrane protein [Corynebacterium kutscheri]